MREKSRLEEARPHRGPEEVARVRERIRKIRLSQEEGAPLPRIFMSPIDNRTPKGIFKDIMNAGKPLFAKSKFARRASLPEDILEGKKHSPPVEEPAAAAPAVATSFVKSFAKRLTPKEDLAPRGMSDVATEAMTPAIYETQQRRRETIEEKLGYKMSLVPMSNAERTRFKVNYIKQRLSSVKRRHSGSHQRRKSSLPTTTPVLRQQQFNQTVSHFPENKLSEPEEYSKDPRN